MKTSALRTWLRRERAREHDEWCIGFEYEHGWCRPWPSPEIDLERMKRAFNEALKECYGRDFAAAMHADWENSRKILNAMTRGKAL